MLLPLNYFHFIYKRKYYCWVTPFTHLGVREKYSMSFLVIEHLRSNFLVIDSGEATQGRRLAWQRRSAVVRPLFRNDRFMEIGATIWCFIICALRRCTWTVIKESRLISCSGVDFKGVCFDLDILRCVWRICDLVGGFEGLAWCGCLFDLMIELKNRWWFDRYFATRFALLCCLLFAVNEK